MYKNILKTSGTNAIILGVNVLTGIMLARFLGPDGRGELAAIQTVVGTISGVALLGLPEAVVYWLSREPERSRQTIRSTLLLFIPIIIISYLLGYFLIPVFMHAQSARAIRDARIYMLSIINISVGSIYIWGFQGFQNYKLWNLLRLLPGLLWLIIIVCGRFLHILSITYLILAILIVPVPSIPIFMRMFWKNLQGPVEPALKRASQLLHYGLPISLSALPQAMNLRLDQLIMAAVVAPKILGYYVIGVTWSGISGFIFSAMGSVLFPKIATSMDLIERNRILEATSRTSVLIAFLVVLPQLLLTPIVLPLFFGKAFSPAVPAAMILVIAGGIIGLNTVLRNILTGLGHPNSLLFAEIIGLVTTVLFLALLLRPYLILGAALASLFSYSITFCFLCSSVKRFAQSSFRGLMFPRISDITFAFRRGINILRAYGLVKKSINLPADVVGKS